MSKLFWTFLALAAVSCQQLDSFYQPKGQDDDAERVPVARVGNTYLHQDELAGIVSPSETPEDSAVLIKRYLDQWVRKQLTMNRASQELNFDVAAIERKVQDYRYALMVHEYEKYYVNQHLDKEMSPSDIETYYSEKSENFVLRQHIVKCLFAVVPLEAPKEKQFKSLMKSYPDVDLEEIQSYCYRFATKSSLESEMWVKFDELIANMPALDIGDKVRYLKSNNFIETKDEENFYFIRLLDYKISGQIAPLKYIQDDIESILINKKKVELRKQLENDIVSRAKENNEFEIYQ